jgi:hypothetical protein
MTVETLVPPVNSAVEPHRSRGRNMRTRTVLRAMGVAALLLAGSAPVGCSSGDDDAADTPIGQALTEKFLENAGVTDEEEARCVASGIVDSIGEARIEELGFTPDEVDMFEGADFTDDEIDTMVDIWFECVDIRQLIATNLAADQGDEVADCFAENAPEDALRDFFKASNFGVDLPVESEQALRDVAAECGLPTG